MFSFLFSSFLIIFDIESGETVTTQSRRCIAETLAVEYTDDSLLLCWGYQNGELIEEWCSKEEDEEDDDQGLGQVDVSFHSIIDLQHFFTEYMG